MHQSGVFERQLGNFPSAINYYSQALSKWELLGSKSDYARTLGNLANVYINQGDFAKGLDTYFKALKIDEELGNKKEIAKITSPFDKLGM